MRALVRFDSEPKQLEVREVETPTPDEGQVLIKVSACGVCGSDLSVYKGSSRRTPLVPGHEFSGEVAEVGKGVKNYKSGDRVTCETAAWVCGECALCRTGNYNLCRKRIGYGFGVDGAFAEYVVAREGALHHVPQNLDLWKASLTEPACVAYNAVGVHSRVEPGDQVVVIGTGCIGLMATQVVRMFGGKPIVVGVSGDEKRLDASKRLGATQVYKSDETDVYEAVMDQTDGIGVPLVVDAVGGVPATVELALRLVRPLGQITKVGWFHGAPNFNMDALLGKIVTLQGSFSHTWPTWERCLQLLADNEILSDEMVSHKLPLDQWRDGYEWSMSREAVKAVICPNDAA